MYQFLEILIRVNKLAIVLAKNRDKENQKDLFEVENSIETIFYQNTRGIFLEEEFNLLRNLERKNKYLLELKEIKWRLMSRAIWL
jgi:hypothetical protein